MPPTLGAGHNKIKLVHSSFVTVNVYERMHVHMSTEINLHLVFKMSAMSMYMRISVMYPAINGFAEVLFNVHCVKCFTKTYD